MTAATIHEIDGQIVLVDPDAVAMIRAVAKYNCTNTLAQNTDRVAHFVNRISERNLTSADVVIVLLNVDDVHGGSLANHLMPGHDWQQYRDRGMVPFARGIAERQGIQRILDVLDPDSAAKLRDMKNIAVVVLDHGVAEVFDAEPKT